MSQCVTKYESNRNTQFTSPSNFPKLKLQPIKFRQQTISAFAETGCLLTMTGKNDKTVMAEGTKQPVALEISGIPFPRDDHLQSHWTGHPKYAAHEDEKCSDPESEDDHIYPATAASDDDSDDDEQSDDGEAPDPGEVQVDAADLELGEEGLEAALADARHIQF